MRKGRDLGISVLISSQLLGPWGSQILKTAGYRIALRTADPETSLRLIGSDAAHRLREKGLGLFCPRLGVDPLLYRGFGVSRRLVRGLVGGDA